MTLFEKTSETERLTCAEVYGPDYRIFNNSDFILALNLGVVAKIEGKRTDINLKCKKFKT